MAEPLCKYFGKCGGCSAQHIDYELQVENKRTWIAQAIGFEDVKAFSGKPYNYRNRMDFIFHNQGLGFREKNRWDSIVDIEECVISDERMNVISKSIREFFKGADAFDARKHSGTYRYAVIRTPRGDESVSFVLNSDSNKIKEAVERIKEFARISDVKNIIVTYVKSNSDVSISDDYFVVKGKDVLKETYLGKTFSYSVQGFFQNNSGMAEKMQEYCHELLKKYGTSKAYMLDLYGGVGTFGIINSGLFRNVTIVEEFHGSVDAANRNIKENNLTNVTAIAMDAKQLQKLKLFSPLYVLTDPPRSGMHPKAIKNLNDLKPEVIIYVSCNPQQLKKEITHFRGYEIKSAAMFDLFPQTPHCESVIELVLKK